MRVVLIILCLLGCGDDRAAPARDASSPDVPRPDAPRLPRHALTLSTDACLGGGTIEADPPLRSHDEGSSVTLRPIPDDHSDFAGWGGDCAGEGTCELIVAGPLTVSARFVPRLTERFAFSLGAPDRNAMFNSLDVGGNGSSVVTGKMSGATEIGGHMIPDGSGSVLAPFAPDGTVPWVHYAVPFDLRFVGAAYDSDGNIAFAATLQNDATLAGTAMSAGLEDQLVIGLLRGTTGEIIWSRQYGDDQYTTAEQMAFDPLGGFVVRGFFGRELTLGGIVLAAPEGARAHYLARFDVAGEVVWARAVVTDSFDELSSLDVSSDGEVLFGGRFKEPIDLGMGPLTNNVDDGTTGFIARYAADGTPTWTRALVAAGLSQVKAVRFGNGGAYAGGSGEGFTLNGVVVDGGIWGRLDGTGAFDRATHMGEQSIVLGLAFGADQVTVGGTFGRPEGPWVGGLHKERFPDLFVAHFDLAGESLRTVQRFGCDGTDSFTGIGTHDGDVYLGGSHHDPIYFGGELFEVERERAYIARFRLD